MYLSNGVFHIDIYNTVCMNVFVDLQYGRIWLRDDDLLGFLEYFC